ncbi:polysaccharide export protein [Hymenobacter roseosalivarius DSM 11622]|uniref:Polysaccharide export protein n=1 Tax=Hymenobacter roseosalivarius DSM 11622 TaxID=645990 RepID=A0A1W1W4R9_9BACT|nr:polysaccharide export protein [Hymenobacter roseosalivarius DSM 11622]
MVYLNDLKGSTEYKTQILNRAPLRLQPGDLLAVSVSSLSPESSILFNNGVLAPPSTANSTDATTVDNAVSNNRQNEGYSIDNEGYITYPVLGRVKLGGLTKEEAIQTMTAAVKKYIKRPIVDIRLLNFRITVLGEVTRPASFTVPQENINVLEALGLAGDMTEYGKRESVLVIREKAGERVSMRLNLHKKEVFDSPYFYLQQNDIVYVEPDNRVKTAQTNPNNRFIAIWGAVISTLGYAIIAIALR